MIIIKGIVFNSNIKIANNKIATGNPASVVILDNREDLKNTKLLQPIAVKENQPIICFVKQRTKNNEFDIRFFTPSGDEVNICGHGSLISGKILKEHFKIKDDEIILHLNKYICLGTMLESDDPTETIYIEKDGAISIKLFKIHFDKSTLNKNELNILQNIIKILGLTEIDIQDYIKCDEYHDLILILKDVNKLRNLNPNFEVMIPYCKQIKDLRSITFSAKSNLKDFDYETRVFAPHINVNEDIVCVSINSILSDYWSRTLNKKTLNVLYPYHWNENICGGIQHINIENKDIILYVKMLDSRLCGNDNHIQSSFCHSRKGGNPVYNYNNTINYKMKNFYLHNEIVGRLLLKPLINSRNDFDLIKEILTDITIMKTSTIFSGNIAKNDENIIKVFNKLISYNPIDKIIRMFKIYNDRNDFIGVVGFTLLNNFLDIVEFGFLIKGEFQSKHIGTDVASFLFKHARKLKNLKNIVITAYYDNTRSTKILEKLGCKINGYFYKNNSRIVLFSLNDYNLKLAKKYLLTKD